MTTNVFAIAPDHVEIGDAGELLNTAQDPGGFGSLNSIMGTLIDKGGGVDDVDLYKICIEDPSQFSIQVDATLDQDNDATMFLFDSDGVLVLEDDDDGAGLLPQFDPGELNTAPGIHYIAMALFATTPELTNNVLSGWIRDPFPFQTGPYTMTLTFTGTTSSLTCEGTPVGGEIIPIDSLALLISAAQTINYSIIWTLLALVVSVFCFSIKRKN